MIKLSIEDVKAVFIMTVYEGISKQIQQVDLKISLLLTWNGVSAAVMVRTIGTIISEREMGFLKILLTVLATISLITAGYFIMRVMIPRKGFVESEEAVETDLEKIKKAEPAFAGLLYTGDILKLGNDNRQRILNYISTLNNIQTHEQVYEQFAKSIVLISHIFEKKALLFSKALISTVIAFVCVVSLILIEKI